MFSIIQKLICPKLKIPVQRNCCDKIFNGKDTTVSTNTTQIDCDGRAIKWPSGNRIKFKFHPDIQTIFNQQINVEFEAFYYYLSMVKS